MDPVRRNAVPVKNFIELDMSPDGPNVVRLSWNAIDSMANVVCHDLFSIMIPDRPHRVYPIPRGGIYAALAVQAKGNAWPAERGIEIVEDPKDADCYVDDIIDSGNTRLRTFRLYGEKPFFALVDKTKGSEKPWYSFPWERMRKEDGPQDNIRRILEYIGEDPERPGLKETPDRVVRSYEELFSGMKQKPEEILKTFDEPADELVLCKNIPFVSVCEHHMMPFQGVAHVGYIPFKGRVVGLSKLARLVDCFARRLQMQERMTAQIAKALDECVTPTGVGVVVEASHTCMSCRGVKKAGAVMTTSSMLGAFRELPAARAEFLQLLKG